MGGRRFKKEERKLNMKKVFLVIIIPIIIALIVLGIKYAKTSVIKYNVKRTGVKGYYTIYENGKWGVINSTGNKIIEPTYDEMIVIPDHKKDAFIINKDVNYLNNEFKSELLNENKTNMAENYDQIKPIEYTTSDLNYDKNLLIAKKGDKYGLIDLTGQEKFKPEFDEIVSMKGIKNKVKIKQGNKYGVINTETNNYVAPAIYDNVEPMYQGEETPYIVKNENRQGVRSQLGKEILKTEYDEIKKVKSDNFVIAKKGQTSKLYNVDGTEQGIISKDVIEITEEKMMIYKNGEKVGLINGNSKEILPAEFKKIVPAGDNNYIVQDDNGYNVVKADKEGNSTVEENKKRLLEKSYENITYDKEAKIYIATNANKEDIYDNELNKKLSDVIYKKSTENYMIINDGKDDKIYNFKFEEVNEKDAYSNNNLIRTKENGKYGYTDREGRVIVAPIYDDAKMQNEYGYIAVSRSGKWGVLNYNGDVIVEPKYDFKNYLLVDFIGEYFRDKNVELETYTKEFKD